MGRKEIKVKKGIKMKKLLTTIFAAASLAVSADMKIGTIDMVDLVRLHPHHESNRALVKSTDADYKDKLAVQQDALKKLARDNFAHLSPSKINVVLEYSHPPLADRIETVEKLIKNNVENKNA